MKGPGLLVLVLLIGLVVGLMVAPAIAGGRPFTTGLTGAAEVGGGDPDGSGTAHITLNQGQGEVCFDIAVQDIATPTRAHIHSAPSGSNGPIVVPFFDFVDPPPLNGCVAADADLIKDIRANPSNYYVNVHTADLPAGAIRGQLSK